MMKMILGLLPAISAAKGSFPPSCLCLVVQAVSARISATWQIVDSVLIALFNCFTKNSTF
jgi:hypothetical protein